VLVEPLAGVVVVALIPEHAVPIFGDQYINAFGFGGSHEVLVAGPVDDRCPGDGAVIRDRNHRQSSPA
jgi:hypothetical protein